MGEDFVRCYIGDIAFSTLLSVQRESGEFDEWQLIDGSEFEHKKSYGYRPIRSRDEALLEALAKRSVIAETKEPESVKPSLLWSNALNIVDVLTLLSLARARYYSTLAVERSSGNKYTIGWGLVSKEMAGSWDIIPFPNFGPFISEALAFIGQNSSWLEESGFIPSIYWYTQAQVSYLTAPSVLEMALYWVSIEILAGTYVDANALGITNKKERVKQFIRDKGYTGSTWDFLDGVVDNWYDTRNALFHEGKQLLPLEVLKTRRQQVRDFVSLVLVEMLQSLDEARKKEIAVRMQGY